MKRRLFFLCLLIFFLLGHGYGFSATNNNKTVRIAYLPITHALPLLEMKELQKEDSTVRVELIRYGSWPELMDALSTGRVDGASVLIELAIKAYEQGVGLKAVALGHHDGNVIIVRPDISSASDLRGKTFAIPHRQSSHRLLLDQLLAGHGMTEADIRIVEMSPPEMAAGLAQGQIAGYCVAEPFGAAAVALGKGKVLLRSDELWPGSLCCALVFNNSFLQDKPGIAANFVKDYVAAGKLLAENPDIARETAKKYLRVRDEILDLSLAWIAYDDLAITQEAYADLIKRMEASGLINKIPAYEDFVDASLSALSAN